MSISRIGAATAAGASLTPSWTGAGEGEIEIAWAYRSGNAIPPGLPAGWVRIKQEGANTNSGLLAYRFCPTSANVATGTFTNATQLIITRYKGCKGIGNVASSAVSSNSISYPALTMVQADGNSWIFGAGGHRTATNVNTAPSGMTNITSVSNICAVHDTNAGVSSWAGASAGVNANSGHESMTIELLADGGAWSLYDSDNPASWSLNTLNKVATRIASASHNGIRQFTGRSTGKWGIGFRHLLFGNEFDMTFGFAGGPGNQSLTAWPDSGVTFVFDEDAVIDGTGNQMYVDAGGGDTTTFAGGTAIEEGQYGSVCIDLDAGLIWICHQNMPDWNNDPTANPNAGTGGIAYTTGKGEVLFPWHSTGNQGSSFAINTWTLNDVAPIWTFPANASDFDPWDNPSVVSSTPAFNPADKSGKVTLSNENLTGTSSGDVNAARVTLARDAGKFFFSGTHDNMVHNYIGLSTSASVLQDALPGYDDNLAVIFLGAGNPGGSPTDWYVVQNNNGSGTAVLIDDAAFADGNVVDVAVNLTAGLIWFRVDGGDWNGSPSADPMTDTGGHTIPAALVGQDLYPLMGGDVAAVFTWDGDPSITLSGYAAWNNLLNSYSLTAAVGSFTVSGNAAALKAGRKIIAAAGTFVVTSFDAVLRYGKRLAADVGAFAVTGFAVGLSLARRLTVAQGAITVTGNSAVLTATRKIVAAVGNFTVTGFDAVLNVGNLGYRLAAAAGSFAVTGFAAGLLARRQLGAGFASFTLTGNAAALMVARRLAAAAGAVTVTGIAAALLATRQLVAATGALAVTGSNVTLQRGKILVAAVGAFIVAAMSAALRRSALLRAGSGQVDIAAQDAALDYDRQTHWEPVPPVSEIWNEQAADSTIWENQSPGASPWSEV